MLVMFAVIIVSVAFVLGKSSGVDELDLSFLGNPHPVSVVHPILPV
jgi:hypothetical protein